MIDLKQDFKVIFFSIIIISIKIKFITISIIKEKFEAKEEYKKNLQQGNTNAYLVKIVLLFYCYFRLKYK